MSIDDAVQMMMLELRIKGVKIDSDIDVFALYALHGSNDVVITINPKTNTQTIDLRSQRRTSGDVISIDVIG